MGVGGRASRKCGGGCETRAAYDKKNKHRCQLGWSSHPQEYFTAVVSVFQAHLPVHRYIDSDAKPLDWKSQGEESDNTGPPASHR